MSLRKILVVGSTGKQGSAFVRAAAAHHPEDPASDASSSPDPRFHVIALTRSPASPAAKELLALGDNVSVAAGDLNDAASVRKVFEDEKAKPEGGIWGVFVALAFAGLGADPAGEIAQGMLITDLACEYGVKHLIYSSVERGDEARDDSPASSHSAKIQIERHVKSKQGLNWTILRPAFFMENFDGFIGRITLSVLRVGLKKDTKLQLIAAEDIGRLGFAVMRSPSAHSGQCIAVLGDALTAQELQDAYARGAGQAMPAVPNALAYTLKAMNKHARGIVEAIEDVNADRVASGTSFEELVVRCREIYPEMQTFEAWARARNAQAERKEGWNGVSLAGLLRGRL
ncbi:NAD(P)-binding protein [Phanerochaete sordida]|uniref:NAD(P)-binding protein n=1 Tax=Phanerochaete sordida TaxID=48140 RepID=A0A9P3GKW5_9APHY|nr:NAD(P)-binding protein [Phanerochaete sordida]